MRSSREMTFDLLCWVELEQSYIELHVESTKRVSGELLNVLTNSLEGEPLQLQWSGGMVALVKAVLTA